MAEVTHEAAAGGRSALRPPDEPLEPEDEAVHLRRPQRHLHHRPAADGEAVPATRTPSSATWPREGGALLFVGTKKQAQDADPRGGRALRRVLRQQPLARRHAHQLPDHQAVDRPPEEARGDARGPARWPRRSPRRRCSACAASATSCSRSLGGIKSMRKLPDALFVIDPKKEEIAVKEANKLGDPGGRGRRHQLRSGPDRLQDPRQRRRDPRHPAVLRRDRRRGASRAEASHEERHARRRRASGGGSRPSGSRRRRAAVEGEMRGMSERRAPSLVQGAAREDRRRHDGLQEGAGRGAGRRREGARLPAREGARRGGEEGGARGQRRARRLVHPRRAARSACSIEVNCETDFVARTPSSRQLVKDLAMQVAAAQPALRAPRGGARERARAASASIYRGAGRSSSGKPAEVHREDRRRQDREVLRRRLPARAAVHQGAERTVEEVVTDAIAQLGENVAVRRFARFQLGETAEREAARDRRWSARPQSRCPRPDRRQRTCATAASS